MPQIIPQINTPDQRVRVFLSSTLKELAPERGAARDAITSMHLTPVMFETGARAHPPRELYRSYLEQSDIFVGIYWQRYGWVAPTEAVSGLEDEYLLSGDKPKLMYIKSADHREPRLDDLLDRIEADDQASYKHFDTTDDLADLLGDDLALLLTERFARADSTPEGWRAARLPAPPTPIIDRVSELASVRNLLCDQAIRLVTLVGMGGIGKTRVAMEIANQLNTAASPFADRVWFVDLSAVTDPGRWTGSVAAALGVRPEGTRPILDLLIDRLQDQRMLLVLDNFEQVLPAAAELGRLLEACPQVTVLVTSRTVLQLRGERQVTLAPLPTPEVVESPAVQVVRDSAAVRLIVARAQQVRPGFVVTTANAAALAELSRRLDGIPLALELAAAQLRLLTPAALVSRLGAKLTRTLDLGAGPVDLPDRQRTLRATLEWSFSLLSENERTLLARLSVLTGSWGLPAAEAVGAADKDIDVYPTLSSLVGQSLIAADDPDDAGLDADGLMSEGPRFRLLNTVRGFATEQLLAMDETDPTLARLGVFLVEIVAWASELLESPDSRAISARVDRDAGNIHTIVNWATRNDNAELVVRLVAPLFTYWFSRGLLPSTSRCAEGAAELPSAADLSPSDAALLLLARGMPLFTIGAIDAAEPLLAALLDAATTLQDQRLMAYALLALGWLCTQANFGRAAELFDRAATIFRALDRNWGLALTLSSQGALALLSGDAVAARAMHLEGLAAAESVDNDQLRTQLLDMLGLDAVASGDAAQARKRYSASAAIHLRLRDLEGSAYGLGGLAALAFVLGLPEASAKLIGASQAARELVGVEVWPGMQPLATALQAAAIEDMGQAAYRAAFADGAGLRITDAFRFGLAATAKGEAKGAIPSWISSLGAAPARSASELVEQLGTIIWPAGRTG